MCPAIDVKMVHVEGAKELTQFDGAEVMVRQAFLWSVERNERAGLDLVERRSLIPERRYRDEYEATGLQHAGHLANQPLNLRDAGVVDDLNGHDAVEEPVGIGQRVVHAPQPQVGAKAFGGEPFAREADGFRRIIQTVDREAQPREVDEMPSRSASEVENAHGGQARQQSADPADVFMDLTEDMASLRVDPVPRVVALTHVRVTRLVD